MKFFPLFFVLLTSSVFGQDYIYFPDSGAAWVNTVYEYDFGDVIPIPVLVDVDYYCVNGEDTLIGAESYTKLNFCSGPYVGAIRDNGGQVFFVPKDSLEPFLLYDFTVEEDDILPAVYFQEGITELTVSFVDSVLVNDIYRTRINFGGSAFWIEGIGNTFGLLAEPWDNISGYLAELHCMHLNDTTYIQSGEVDFNPGATCPFDLGINENELAVFKTIVFPNPSTGTFTLQSDLDLSDATLILTDLTGKNIEGTVVRSANQFQIDLNATYAGVFLLTIYKEDQLFQYRLIKE